MAKQTKQMISLSQPNALAGGKLEIDEQTGTIGNVAILSRGTALGHGFDVDDKMLRQARDGINKTSGVKVHLTHAHAMGSFLQPTDGLTDLIGSVQPGARIENGIVRATVKLGDFARNSPNGNMRDFILGLAKESPAHFGLSIVFTPDDFEERKDERGMNMPPAGRIKELHAVDFVGQPGANPNGLLQAKSEVTENEVMNKEALKKLGLAEDATAEQVNSAIDALSNKATESDKAKAALDAKLEKLLNPEAHKGVKDEPSKEALAVKARLEGAEAERKRSAHIHGIAERCGLGAAWASEMVNGGFDVPTVNEKALAKVESLRGGAKPPSGEIIVGEDNKIKMLRSALPDAIRLRAGANVPKAHEEAQGISKLNLLEMQRKYLHALGVPDVHDLSRSRLVELLSYRRFRDAYPTISLAQSTSDFDNILIDAINKSLRQAYMDAPKSWSLWCRKATASDFKTIYRTALSEAPNLTAIDEGGGLNYVTMSDGKESYALAEYNGGIKLTRRAIINDDLDAFSRIPMLQASSAARKEDDVAYAILTANAAMADSVALFHATHANLIAAGGGAPTVTTVGATQTLLAKQKGPKSAAFLNLRASFIIVPSELEVVTQQLINSVVDPAKNNSTVNPFSSKLQVIAEPRLSATSATVWYLAANPNAGQIDTVEVCFLADEQMPVLSQETDFDTDDQKFKVRHTVAAKAIDFRGMAKNPGA